MILTSGQQCPQLGIYISLGLVWLGLYLASLTSDGFLTPSLALKIE